MSPAVGELLSRVAPVHHSMFSGPQDRRRRPGGPRRPQEARGSARRPQDAPGGHGKLQEAPAGFRRRPADPREPQRASWGFPERPRTMSSAKRHSFVMREVPERASLTGHGIPQSGWGLRGALMCVVTFTGFAAAAQSRNSFPQVLVAVSRRQVLQLMSLCRSTCESISAGVGQQTSGSSPDLGGRVRCAYSHSAFRLDAPVRCRGGPCVCVTIRD